MIKNEIFDNYSFNESKLVQYGFQKNNDLYTLITKLSKNNMEVYFQIRDNYFEVNVYEDKEVYLPFNVVDASGKYVLEIKQEVDILIEKLLKNCFDINNIKQELLEYTQGKYHTLYETPWEKYPTYQTLKTSINKKWYTLFMTIPYRYLKIEKNGNIDVLNLRVDSKKIEKLIDNKNFFKAYHMNKKNWITILLNTNLNLKQIEDLIDESYSIMEKKK